jgi:LysR family transcriptional regulator, glycine cleavage system transcriptional activator
MRHRLPPLNALRAFEAAGRHESFSDAAKELNVTAGAVSRHVKLLEDYLQLELFERSNQRIQITTRGMEYLPKIRRALDIIDSATSQLIAGRGKSGLTLRILPTLAIRWFIPHFPSFQKRHPSIRVSITTAIDPPDFDKEEIDVGICRGATRDPSVRAELFAQEELVLVGRPSLLAERRATSLEWLRNLTWLVADTRPDAWQSWLEGMGVADLVPQNTIHFEQLNMALQAAVAGLGITVAPRLFVADDLAAGHLAAMIDKSILSAQKYYLVYPEAKADLPSLQAFRAWLLEEVERPTP